MQTDVKALFAAWHEVATVPAKRAGRPEKVRKNKVVNPETFVEGIEELVVCHCDEVPDWLSIGSQKQLYRARS